MKVIPINCMGLLTHHQVSQPYCNMTTKSKVEYAS